MSRMMTLLTTAGIGAGLMFLADPKHGARRRARLRNQVSRWMDDAQGVAESAASQAKKQANRFEETYSDMAEGFEEVMHGGFSPQTRALMTGVGGCMFLYGLTQKFPVACVLGTVGLALVGEGIANADLDDIRQLPDTIRHIPENVRNIPDRVADMAGGVADRLTHRMTEMAGNGKHRR